MQFTKARARARDQQADVIGDFGERNRERIEHARELHQSIVRGKRFEFIAGWLKRDTGYRGDLIGDGDVEAFGGI